MAGVLKVYADGAVRTIGCSSTSTVFADDFDRPDDASSLGSPWVAYVGTWGATGGAAHLATGSVQAIAAVETGVSDCTVAVNISSAFPQGGGLSWRVVDGSNCWFWDYDSSGAGATPGSSVYKYVSGTLTQVLTGLPPTSTHRISVELNGSSHTLKIDGSTVATFSDSAHQTATEHGLRDFGAQAVLDNFEVTVPTSGLLKGYFDGRIWREACAADTSTPADTLTNPGAESGTTGWRVDPDDFWTPIRSIALSTTGSPVRTGSAAFALHNATGNYGGAAFESDQGGLVCSDGGRALLGVVPGATVGVSGYARTDGWLGYALAHFDWYAADGTLVSANHSGLTTNINGTGWTSVGRSLTAPAGAAALRIGYLAESNSAETGSRYVYWDDLTVTGLQDVGPERRPIKVYDGTTTRTICMVPV